LDERAHSTDYESMESAKMSRGAKSCFERLRDILRALRNGFPRGSILKVRSTPRRHSGALAQACNDRADAAVRRRSPPRMGVYAPLDEAELRDDRSAQRERVEIGQPHAAVKGIGREGQWNPRVDQPVHIGRVYVKIGPGREPLRQLRRYHETKRASDL